MKTKLNWIISLSFGFILLALASIFIIFGALETNELFIKIGLIAIIIAVIIYSIIIILLIYNYLKRR